eukprot:346799-Chlamydomonas_euryale.AAC.3
MICELAIKEWHYGRVNAAYVGAWHRMGLASDGPGIGCAKNSGTSEVGGSAAVIGPGLLRMLCGVRQGFSADSALTLATVCLPPPYEKKPPCLG